MKPDDLRGALPARPRSLNSPHKTSSHVPPLDGIRGMSAITVVIAHASRMGLFPPVPGALSPYAVMVFFVLSGFLMGYLYLDKPCDYAAGSSYSAARISRIVPLYYGIVLLSWIIYNYIDSTFFYEMSNVNLIRHLLFLGSVSYFWSIGPEVQFYAVFLVLWWAVERGKDGDWRALTFLLMLTAVVFVFQPLFAGITVFSKLHIFMLGVGLAAIHRTLASTLRYSRLGLAFQLGVLTICLLAAVVPTVHHLLFAERPPDPLVNAFFGDARRVMFAVLIVFAFSFETRFADMVFANPLARRLGAYSYSIYLLHGPVLWGLERAGVFGRSGPTLGFVVALLAIYAVAWLSFTFIEGPSQRLLRTPVANRLNRMAVRFGQARAN